jgi:two-component system cell cycle sensor histidine kinase/response regulator CckA
MNMNFNKVSQALSSAIIAIGISVLIGWFFDLDFLKSVVQGLASMKPNTAIALILSGGSILLASTGRHRIAIVLAGAVAMIGGLTLSEYATGVDLHIDQAIFVDDSGPYPGRISIASSFIFLLLGAALIFFHSGISFWWHQSLLIMILVIALITLIGYLFDVSSLYRISIFASIALHTAFCDVLLCLAVLFARPKTGIMRIVTADTSGGVMVRQLLPIAIFLPVLLGWLRMSAQKAGLLDAGFGVALIVSVNIIIFSTLILLTGRSLDKGDRENRKVEEARAQLASIVESSDDAIISKTLEGDITSWNAGAFKMYGYSADEIVGKPISLIIPPERSLEMDEILHNIRNESRVEHLETIRVKKDGTKIAASITVSPVRNRANEIIGASAIGRNITERKNLEQQLLQSQKMEAIGQLAGGVAHDFNNLLTAILGYGELALIGINNSQQTADNIRQIIVAGERAASLTQQLLAFSRKQIIQYRPLSLTPLIGDMEKMLKRLIGEDVKLQVILSPDLRNISADSGQIDQIALNLAVNARDAMPGGGTLTIETQNLELDQDYADRHISMKPGTYVMLAISDTGTGMDEETKSRIFEPFFTTKGVGKGTGLGLSTVYGIVKQMDGHIWVYSEIDKGTTFKIYFPATEITVEVAQPGGEHRRSPNRSETILLVEDEDIVRAMVIQSLKGDGYNVLTASEPKAALELFARHSADIEMIISDMVMPGISGLELIEQLLSEKPELKILYISGYTDHTMLNRGVLTSKFPFLQKPFNTSTLLNKVREILDM